MPTASGKSALARTLQSALYSVSAITPTNQLVEQFLDEFPDTPTLHRLDSYWCDKWDRPCPVTRAKTRNFCNQRRDECSCPAASDLSTAKYRSGPGIYNYYTYLAHKLHREILVVDEAHLLAPVIRDRMALHLWKHDYKYPERMYTVEQMREWILTLPPKTRKHKKIVALWEAVNYDCPKYIARRAMRDFNGKGTLRGRPEERDCIELVPVDIADAPDMFWPRNIVSKIVLMSGTIGEKEIEQLGVGKKRRTLYIECKSPIPPASRQIIPLNTTAVNRNNMTEAVPKLVNEIKGIAEYHTGEKGIIHATYQLAGLLRAELYGEPRFMFHDRSNKKEVYQKFRDSDPKDGAILVASGMYEGIDLPEDLGRWQVISKIPWPSLGDPAIAHISKLDPDAYLWDTIKTTVQAVGRICRTPTDVGTTYILDSSFNRMYREGEGLIPDYFKEAIVWPT